VRSRGPLAGAAVLLSALIGAGINLATSNPGTGIISGVAILLVVVEWRRASSSEAGSSSSRAQINVDQAAERVDGVVAGGRNAPASTDVEVRQRIGEVSAGGYVVGYDSDDDT
jgi:hypothetical protein